jgi:hypothetical protein
MSTLSLIVVETQGGAEVRVRDSEELGERYPDVYAALDSLLTDPEYLPKPGILRDESGSPSGRWRWLDATAEEPAPAEDGSQVTRDLIARMAARLNSGSPAPIDGVSSEPHQQLYATGTHADGYAHVGVEVRDRSGRWHLFLYSELSPEAARVINAGLVWSGSIGFTNDGRLLQHALTNVPAVEGLRPNNATRHHHARRVHTRSMRITMPQPHKRATLADAEQMLLEMTGADPENLGTALIEMVAAHKAKMAEAEASKPAEAPAAEEKTAERDAAPPVASEAPRAEAFPDAAAMEMFASETLNMLRDVFGEPDDAPAAVLEKFKASLSAFKGALGQAAPPVDAGAMSASGDIAAKSAIGDAHKRALDENAKLRADLARRDLRDAIAKRATDAKVALPELDQLVSDALAVTDVAARERMIASAVRAAQTVPSGDVFGRSAPGAVGDPESVSEARAKCEPEVRAEFPSYADNEVRATALRRAAKRWPHLFESPAR